MPTNLEEILYLPAAKPLALLTKHSKLKRTIAWTHTVEDAENMRFVEKDNLIFMTGIAIQENQEALLKFIKDLYDKQTAGVIINTGKYITSIADEIIEFANSVDYPILTFPWEVKITDINRGICEYIIKHANADRNLEDLIKTIIFNKGQIHESEINHIIEYGFDVEGRYMVMVVELAGEQYSIDERISNQAYNIIRNMLMRVYEKHVCFFQDNKIIGLLPSKNGVGLEGNELKNKLLQQFDTKGKTVQVKVGFGKICTGIRNSYKSYEEALKVIFINSKRNNYEAYLYEELGFYKLVLDIKDSQEMRAIYDETIGKLASYDKMHHTDYVEVLKLYLLENKSIAHVSKKLYIHRNTVTYKLKKIEELLEVDLNLLDDTIKVKLAILVQELL
ncbi:MAG: hypothetical protein K0S30_338 [Clostridia bacterium]|jgi:sugar diacid utilization regulator|nr:hypothetical protein [Clostridia bacterium]